MAITDGRTIENSPVASACSILAAPTSSIARRSRPFTEPIVRLDLDRMDDNDNRLSDITAEIMWVPKPAYRF